jgi:asparagine synthase (glutamine-hydrolysing)
MCGLIAGNLENIDIVSALNSIRNRGPDNQNYILVDGIFIGHSLLSIHSEFSMDSVQPFVSNDGDLIVAVNGEIYNYNYLKQELLSLGYNFTTVSDCEVIVHGLKHFGDDFIKRLDGEFVFISYCRSTKQWLAATDRWGTKPLKYSYNGGRIAFGSNVQSLKSMGLSLTLDKYSVLYNLSNLVTKSGSTLFENIRSLTPSSILKIGDRGIRVTTYETQCRSTNYDLGSTIENSILKRVPTNKKIAVALSGGIDSSVVAYYLQKNQVPFQSYSIDFINSEYSERSDIQKFISRHSISTNFLEISDHDLINNFKQAVINSETIAINPHIAAQYCLNKRMIDDGYKVIMTGQGADEIFYGYSHFHTDDEYQYLSDIQNTRQRFRQFNLLKDNECRLLDDLNMMNVKYSDAQTMYIDHWLVQYGLGMLGDSQSSSIGQEYRYPFLDYELSSILPKEYRTLNFPSKQQLRNVVSHWDPQLSTMRKRPFTSPIINESWRDLFNEYVLENKHIQSMEWVNLGILGDYFDKINTDNPPNRMILAQFISLGILTTI